MPRKKQKITLVDHARVSCIGRIVEEMGRLGAFKAFKTNTPRIRTIQAHLAREAYGFDGAKVSRLLNVSRSGVCKSHQRVWQWRDADPDFDALIWGATDRIKEMG